MTDKTAIVITTINAPTRAVQEIARDCHRLDAHFILIGDTKTPSGFEQTGASYLDIDAQTQTGFALARLAHTKHYARKNIGYLVAMRDGADVIIETDDDNIPGETFWPPRTRHIAAPWSPPARGPTSTANLPTNPSGPAAYPFPKSAPASPPSTP